MQQEKKKKSKKITLTLPRHLIDDLKQESIFRCLPLATYLKTIILDRGEK